MPSPPSWPASWSTVTSSVATDSGVHAVVLTAAGDRAFCVGADLKERNAMSDADFRAQRMLFRAAFGGVLNLPQPTVAAVHGFALGGGSELALSCDLVVADETAVMGLPEVTIGLVPGGGGTQLAVRRLGPGRAADVVLTGRRIPAEEAHQLGLIDRSCRRAAREWRRRRLPRRSRRTHRWRPARRSGRCGQAGAWTTRRPWTWKTRHGARRRSRPTAKRASRRSTTSASPNGRVIKRPGN